MIVFNIMVPICYLYNIFLISFNKVKLFKIFNTNINLIIMYLFKVYTYFTYYLFIEKFYVALIPFSYVIEKILLLHPQIGW